MDEKRVCFSETKERAVKNLGCKDSTCSTKTTDKYKMERQGSTSDSVKLNSTYNPSCPDSAYGSMKATDKYTSSNSNLSMGSSLRFGSHSGYDGIASTSGYSSITLEKRNKKEKVKKCLEELKLLMPSPQARERNSGSGILSTLQNVLSHMKKISDHSSSAPSNAPKSPSQMDADIELLGGHNLADPLGSAEYKQSIPEICDSKGWYTMVLSMKESLVLQVSPELLDMLGYPRARDMQDYTNNYFFNQSILDYVYKKDVATVTTNLSMCQNKKTLPTGVEDKDGSNGFFFFRLRNFKSLRQGYSLTRPERYSVFCASVIRQKVELNFHPGTPAEGLQLDNNYIVLKCKPVHSAYTAKDTLPEQNAFVTRHTLFCNFSFMHPSMIPLLGYLPQDFIGTSVFDYYHPQDLRMLLPIYQQVVQNPGKTVHSSPYRIRAKNGDFVLVETEWSSFVNPWTKMLDFIIGHHTVVKGPQNLDVFAESAKKQQMEYSEQENQLKRLIPSLLLKHVSGDESGTVSNPMSSTLDMPIDTVCIEENMEKCPSDRSAVTFTEEAVKMSEETPEEDLGNTAGTKPSSSVSSMLDREKGLIYQQLSYTQNIRRYLLSCATVDGGDGSQMRSSSNEESEVTEEESLAMEVNVDINLQHVKKPPSYASSTKALVSEQEREEIMPPSPAHEEVHEEIPQKGAIVDHVDDIYEPKSLTEDLLQRHNKIQEQMYIDKLVSEKFVSLQGEKNEKGNPPIEKVLRKRSQPASEGKLSSKFLRQNDGQAIPNYTSPTETNVLAPPFPFTTSSMLVPRSEPITARVPHMGSGGMLPVSSVMSNVITTVTSSIPVSTSGLANQNVPTYSAAGMLGSSSAQTLVHVPVIIGSTGASVVTSTSGYPLMLYSPDTRVFQHFSSPPVHLTGSMAEPIKPIARKKQTKSATATKGADGSGTPSVKENECSDSNSLETTSSLLYLLESEGNMNTNSGSGSSEEEGEQPYPEKLPEDPPWVQTVNWSPNLRNKYQVPLLDMQKKLYEDQKALEKMTQPDIVYEQLCDLLADIEVDDGIAPWDEEADLLFVMEEKETDIDKSQESRATQSVCILPEIKENILEDMDEIHISDNSDETEFEIGMEDKVINSEVDQIEKGPESNKSCELPNSKSPCSSDKMENDSDSSETGWSKGSSSITPSDQRSNEEIGSSVKESDSLSSESGSAKDMKSNPPSDSDTDALSSKNWFSRLFVHNTINLIKEEKCVTPRKPPWLQVMEFTESLQMKYSVGVRDLKTVLKEDKACLAAMTQPSLVKKQMTKLLSEIKKCEVAAEIYGADMQAQTDDSDITEKTADVITSLKDKNSSCSDDSAIADKGVEIMSTSDEAAHDLDMCGNTKESKVYGYSSETQDNDLSKTSPMDTNCVPREGLRGKEDGGTSDTGHGTESSSETEAHALLSNRDLPVTGDDSVSMETSLELSVPGTSQPEDSSGIIENVLQGAVHDALKTDAPTPNNECTRDSSVETPAPPLCGVEEGFEEVKTVLDLMDALFSTEENIPI